MKILSKGINLVSNLSGSSYLLEIENLAKHHKYVVVLVDNNHQVDSLFDELKNIHNDKVITVLILIINRIRFFFKRSIFIE